MDEESFSDPEEDDDIYSEDIDGLLDNSEISAGEYGFMRGYNSPSEGRT